MQDSRLEAYAHGHKASKQRGTPRTRLGAASIETPAALSRRGRQARQGIQRGSSAAESTRLVVLGGEDVMIDAAKNYRKLRNLGITVRGTFDVVLATRCIVSGYLLLHSDRDFDVFATHLGLQCVASDG